MKEQERAHLVYLLQLWRGDDRNLHCDDAANGWRASLSEPKTLECRRFSSLLELFAYIEEQTSRTFHSDV